MLAHTTPAPAPGAAGAGAGWLRRHPATVMALVLPLAWVLVGGAAALGPLAGVAMVAAVALALVVVDRPAVGALVLVAAVPVVSGLRRGLPVPVLRPSELLVATLAPLVLVVAGRRHLRRWGPFDWSLLAYCTAHVVMGLVNLLRRGETIDTEALGTLANPFQFLLLFRAVAVTLHTTALRDRALRIALQASVVASVIAILQQFDMGPTRAWIESLLDTDIFENFGYQGFNRATGLFPHWNVLAGYLFLVVSLTIALLLSGSERVMSRRGLVGVLGAGLTALVLSATIAATVGVVGVAIALGIWYGRIRRVAQWGVVGAVLVFVLFGSFLAGRFDQQYDKRVSADQNPLIPHSFALRMEIWTEQYVPAVASRLVTGYGPDLPPEIRWGYTESVYITLLLRGGLPLLMTFAWLMAAWVRRAARSSESPDDVTRALARLLACAVAALIPMQFVFPYLANSGLPHLLFALMGVLVASETPREADVTAGTVVRAPADVALGARGH